MLAATSIVADRDEVAMAVEMNANPLSCVITVDVKDPNVASGNTLGRLLANLAHKN